MTLVKQTPSGVDKVMTLLASTALGPSQVHSPVASLETSCDLATSLAEDGSHLSQRQRTAVLVGILASQVMPSL